MSQHETVSEPAATAAENGGGSGKIERGPVVVGFDAVRLVRQPNGAISIEAWRIQDQCWKRAEIPPEVVMRAPDADDAFLDAVFMPPSQRMGIQRTNSIE
jgi:hypothetical protein